MTLSEANSKALLDLAERVEAGSGSDFAVDHDVFLLCCGGRYWSENEGLFERPYAGSARAANFTTSLDASVSLLERVLPGWHWAAEDGARAHVVRPESSRCEGRASSPARALLSAILKALAATREEKEVG